MGSDEGYQHFNVNTDAARSLGIFGAPLFVADGKAFWDHECIDDDLRWLTDVDRVVVALAARAA